MNVHVVRASASDADLLLDVLRRNPAIDYAEPDGIAQAAFVPNDPCVATGSEWHLAKIQAPQAWDITRGDTNVVVAILDSGINAAHPDLSGRIVPGFNFVSGTTDTSDDFGHGTAVAGTALASANNSNGVAGVAFGCSILPVKVVNGSGFAFYSAIADGIHFAVDHGARVINISIAGSSSSITLQEAVDYAWSNNVVVVAAAGNEASSDPQYPAACNHVLAVSATEPDDSAASFSSYGPWVSVSAPGDNIWTTQSDLTRPYGPCRGTSFASPIVAGVAALVASANPTLSNDQIVSHMQSGADDQGTPGFDPVFGYGRVNAFQSVLLAAASAGPQPSPVVPTGTAVVSCQIIGPGRVLPDLNGKPLPLGTTCHLRAVAAPGHVFAGWTGFNEAAPFADIDFVVQSNVTLVASFVPSPFLPFKGAFAGLVVTTNAMTTRNCGYLRLNLTSSGRFTGRLLIDGSGFGFAGDFNSVGGASVIIGRSAGRLALDLHLDVFGGTEQLAGNVSCPEWSSDLLGFRNVFNPRSNPAPQTGIRAFDLEDPWDQTETNAVVGHIRTLTAGSAYSRGRIDGVRPFGWTSIVSRTGDYPFYISRNRGNEVLIGWLNLPADSGSCSGTVARLTSGTNAVASVLAAGAP